MKFYIYIFLLLSIIKFSYGTNCTRFEKTEPSSFDLKKITREVHKERPPPVLEDFGNEISYDCQNGIRNENPNLIADQVFRETGLEYEKHTVITEDGYLLTHHRIPKNGKVVVLAHGLFGSSLDWLVLGKNSLPYILSEKGYDVWLLNSRGNKFTNHEELSKNCAQFWNFTYEEIGLHDLPATVDYILKKNGKEKITYIGHSIGATAFFVFASMLPDYNEKFELMIALAPIAWTSHVKSPLVRFLKEGPDMERAVLNSIGRYEFSPSDSITHTLSDLICDSGSVLCWRLPFLITGFNKDNLDASLVPKITRLYPSGFSSRILIHLAQGVCSGEFRRFEYNKMNLDKYGFLNPPDYPLNVITTKVFLYYSNNDWMSNSTDVNRKLVYNLYKVKDAVNTESYSHYDYVWGKNAKEDVYGKILHIISK